MGVLRFLHPVVRASAVKQRPVRVQVDDAAYVLFRDRAGKIAALADACPHRHASLALGRVLRDGRVECAYHGWRFDADGRGESATRSTNASCDTLALRAVERHGYVWLQTREVPASEPPDIARDGYALTGTFSVRFSAPLPVVLDNFSENEHVPFVHTRLGWDRAALDSVQFDARNFDDRTEVSYRARQRWSPLMRVFSLQPGDTYRNEWVTRFDPVRTEYAISWSNGAVTRPMLTRSTIFFVPETAQSTWLHVFVTTKLAAGIRLRAPLFRAAANRLGRIEVEDDARFVRLIHDSAPTLDGMKLGRFDKPVIHNRKLLRDVYYRSARDAHVHDASRKVALAVVE